MDTAERTVRSDVIRNRAVFVLSLFGVLVAIYVLQSFLRQSSIVCLTAGGCEAVRKSPASYIYGVPVPAFGLIGYSLLLLLSFLRSLSPDKRYVYGMLGIALFGISFVTWFTFVEIFVIKGICTWCAISSVNMYIIFALVVLTLATKRKHKEDQV